MDKDKVLAMKRAELIEKLKSGDFLAKLIAAYIRNNIEDFHSKYLNDSQMAELNKQIRDGAYTAVLDIEHLSPRAIVYIELYIPEYWEECEYIDTL